MPTDDKPTDDPAPQQGANPPSNEQSSTAPQDANANAGAGPDSAADDLARLVELEAAVREAENRYLRSQAELENFRKRSRRELDDQMRFAAAPLITDLLPVLDNLQRAVEAAQNSGGDAQSLIDGVRMVADQFRSALEKHHCRQIPAAGEIFDPHFHSAIGHMPTSDTPPGTIAHVAQEGYQLHDRVVRPAQVLIAVEPDQAGNNDSNASAHDHGDDVE